MKLKILLPFGAFLDQADVASITVVTLAGSFGLLPNRLDCIAALAPGILSFEAVNQGEAFVAVDQGVLIKTETQVLVSVRRAVAGVNLAQLRDAVARDFLTLDDQARQLRQLMAKIESGFMRRFTTFTA